MKKLLSLLLSALFGGLVCLAFGLFCFFAERYPEAYGFVMLSPIILFVGWVFKELFFELLEKKCKRG